MTKPLEGKAAVVTGGGRGVGRAIAIDLAAHGARVVVNDIGAGRDGGGTDSSPAEEVVATIREAGGTAVASYNPIDDYNGGGQLVQACANEFGSLDILVNCAGVLRERMIWNMSEDDWDTVIRVHLKGHYNTCHHAAKLMRTQRSGVMINVSSTAWLGTVGQSNYGAAKAGIVGLTRALARELGRYDVRVNALCPSAATRMTLDEGVINGMKKRVEAGLITQERFERFMEMPGPEFVPPIVTYLASEEAKHVTGKVFYASKGKIAIFTDPVELHSIHKGDDGLFTFEELKSIAPSSLLQDYVSPVPKQS